MPFPIIETHLSSCCETDFVHVKPTLKRINRLYRYINTFIQVTLNWERVRNYERYHNT